MGLKKSDGCVSLGFPMALAPCLKAIFKQLLPVTIFLNNKFLLALLNIFLQISIQSP
jgi:hypothetical protein